MLLVQTTTTKVSFEFFQISDACAVSSRWPDSTEPTILLTVKYDVDDDLQVAFFQRLAEIIAENRHENDNRSRQVEWKERKRPDQKKKIKDADWFRINLKKYKSKRE